MSVYCHPLLASSLSSNNFGFIFNVCPHLSDAPLGDAAERLLGIFMGAEGGEADIALAGRTEADARCADNACAIEQLLEEFP